MAYLVVAYPELDTTDYTWIQEYRQKYAPRYYSLIEPHITLVFAIDDIEQTAFVEEVTKQLEHTRAFDFVIRAATINKDDSGEYYHEFLVPDEGNSNIIKLHDKLYSGLFAKHLRYDLDFISHIGIGDCEDVTESKQRVDNLNAKDLVIKGRVSNVDIIEYTDGVITTLKKIELTL